MQCISAMLGSLSWLGITLGSWPWQSAAVCLDGTLAVDALVIKSDMLADCRRLVN